MGLIINRLRLAVFIYEPLYSGQCFLNIRQRQLRLLSARWLIEPVYSYTWLTSLGYVLSILSYKKYEGPIRAECGVIARLRDVVKKQGTQTTFSSIYL